MVISRICNAYIKHRSATTNLRAQIWLNLNTVRKDSIAARSTLTSSASRGPTLAPHKHIHNECGRGAQTVLSCLKKVLYFMPRSPRNRN